jgi:peroxiredoxin (alkyl hydroperoxide reductase subunit C)
MRKKFTLTSILFLVLAYTFAQKDTLTRIPLIGEDAPAFIAETTNGILNFPSDFGKKWKILFSHPADFTPVCSSEILELAYMQNDFDQLDAKLVIISTDQIARHFAWKKALEDVSLKNREPVKIKFPFLDDNNRMVSKSYGMISPKVNDTKAVRGVFIIDPENKIASVNFYPMSVGRNIEEIKRSLIALQTTQKQQVLMPANWKPGEDVMLPYISENQRVQLASTTTPTDEFSQIDADILSPYFDEYRDTAKPYYNIESPDIYSLNWFMFYKKNK